MKALTKAQIQEASDRRAATADCEGFQRGKQFASEQLAHQFASAKLQQLQAAAKLMEEAGRIMSRAGYMIGKINGDNNR